MCVTSHREGEEERGREGSVEEVGVGLTVKVEQYECEG